MNKLLNISIISILGISTLWSEPSVYSNLNGAYDTSDKMIYENKKTILNLQNRNKELNERIDGLKSIVEGLSKTVGQLKQKSDTPDTKSAMNTKVIKSLAGMIDDIHKNYVTNTEFSKALGKQELSKKVLVKKESNKVSSVKKAPVEVIAGAETKKEDTALINSQTYSEGVKLYVKHRYDEAKKRFVATDKAGYKAAPSNYYMGEISYYTKKYDDAIFYYKKSAGLNDKASYIDVLLLHTGIALENTGKKEQAKAFYDNIIANYPENKSAQIAKEKLSKL